MSGLENCRRVAGDPFEVQDGYGLGACGVDFRDNDGSDGI